MSLSYTNAQNINWSSKDDNQKNHVYANFGYDFGVTTQLGYAYQTEYSCPIILLGDYSFPMGKNLVDDFKVRIGGLIPIYEINNFKLTTKVFGVFRRHETDLVRILNFGSELAAVMGYYKSNYHIAGEFGFDKSINSHLKHSDEMRENFLSISDGWFIPSGGHFYYGLQGSKTVGDNIELSLRAGATNAQFNDENALLPIYTQLGLIYKIQSSKEK